MKGDTVEPEAVEHSGYLYLDRLAQEDHKFKTNLNNTMRFYKGRTGGNAVIRKEKNDILYENMVFHQAFIFQCPIYY